MRYMMYNSKYYENKVARVKFSTKKVGLSVWVPDYEQTKWSHLNDNTCTLKYSGTRGGTIPSTIAKSDWYNTYLMHGEDGARKDPLNPLMTCLIDVSLVQLMTFSNVMSYSDGIVFGQHLNNTGKMFETVQMYYEAWLEDDSETASFLQAMRNFKKQYPEEYYEAFDTRYWSSSAIYSFSKGVEVIQALLKLGDIAGSVVLCTQAVSWWNNFCMQVQQAQHIVDTTFDDEGNPVYSGYDMTGWSATFGGSFKSISTKEHIDNLTTNERVRGRFWQVNGSNTTLSGLITTWKFNVGSYTLY